MHKRFRKIISILLATMMIAGTIPTTVFATEENGVSQVVQEEQPTETVPSEQAENNVIEEKSKDTSSDSSIDLISANASDKQQDDSVVGSNEISITEQAAAETAVSDEEQVSQEEAQQSPSEVSLTEEQEMTSDAASDVAEPTNDDISLTETESTWLETFINGQNSVETTADFSSCRLILGTANADVIIDREHIMSEYNGVYLLQYASESEAQLAYKYYYDKADFVEPDITVSVADGEEVAEAPDGMTEEANPLNELENAIIEDSSSVKKNVIALIDTGVSDDNAVIDRTSMLGDAVDDDNGHGNRMLETILAVNPNARIISIKALDENGVGTISSVYAAMKYAIERNASIINLSISAYSTADNAAVADVIREAVNAGITVVGAAGNNGRNAKYFVPGGIKEAMIVGACDANGQKIAKSNYGDTVDYNVVAEYTSEAAAKMSSYLSANKTIEVNTNGLIYTTDYVEPIKEDDSENGNLKVVERAGHKIYLLQEDCDIVVPEDVNVGEESVLSVTSKDKGAAPVLSGLILPDGTPELKEYPTEAVDPQECDSVDLHYNEGVFSFVMPDADIILCAGLEASSSDFVTAWGNVVIDGNKIDFTKPGSSTDTRFGPEWFGGATWHKEAKIKYTTTVGGKQTTQTKTYQVYCLQPSVTGHNDSGKKGITEIGDLDGDKRAILAKALYLFKTPLWGADITNSKGKKVNLKDYFMDNKYGKATSDETYCMRHYVLGYLYYITSKDPSAWTWDHNITSDAGKFIKAVTEKIDDFDRVECNMSYNGGSKTTTVEIAENDLTKDGNIYKTKPIKYNSYLENTLKITLDSSVTCVNETKNTSQKGGTVSIRGGDTFHFEQNATEAGYTAKSTYAPMPSIFTIGQAVQINTRPASDPNPEQDCGFAILENEIPLALSIEWPAPYGYGYLKKKSSNEKVSKGNANYALGGAEYGVYSDAECTKSVGKLITKIEANGEAVSDPIKLTYGTYYVKETKAPKGYKLSSEVKSIKITAENDEPKNAAVVIFSDEPEQGYAYIVKTSAVSEMTKGNKCYDLQGAVYEVFSDEACTKLVTTLTTGAEKDGKAETERKQIPINTYYVREKKAPKGYVLDPEIIPITVTASNNTAEKAAVINVKDEPKDDPLVIELTKEPTDSSQYEDFPPLSNAEFTIKYYDGLYTKDTLPTSATRTWVIKTIKDEEDNAYIAAMDAEACRVSGDAYYTNSAGKICLPIGTITIQETKAPYDYSLAGGKISTSAGEVESDGMVIAQIKEETGRAHLEITNTLTAGDPKIKIETIATDKNTGTHFGRSKGDVEIIDTISYENVYDSGTYRFHGKLVDASDNSVITEAYSAEFEPAEGGKGTGEVSFSTDLKAYEGKTVVAYEYLEKKDGDKWEERAKHDEVTDEDQQIYVPKIRTTVTDAREGVTVETHVAEAEKDAKLTDTIFYENLEAGKTYKFNGILAQIQEDGTAVPFRDPSGKEVTSETTKTIPENEAASDRFVKMDFEFDASELKNESLVVFEKCYLVKETGDGTEQVEVAEHEDPNDEKQTIHFPEITTTVTDDKTGTDHTEAEEESTITDRVYFSNVVPNIVYEVKGTVHDQKTGNEIPAEVVGATYNGESVLETTGEGALSEKAVRFKPTAKEGYVDVTFKFNSKDLEGTTAVVFEELYVERRVAVHADLKAQPQTDYIPKVRTSVRSDDTDTNLSNNNEEVYLTDTVAYHSLKPKTTYRVYGTLHIQDEDEEGNIVDGGIAPSVMVNEEHEEIPYYEFTTAEAPESNPNAGISGSVDVHFRMNLTDYEGKTLVCFEKLNLVEEGRDEVEVGRHEEIQDEAQSLHIPEIGTSAADKNSGLHVGLVDENVTVTDIVRFHNVVPGKTYKVRGILMERVVKESSEATTEPTDTTDEASDANGDAQTNVGQTDDAVEGQTDTDGQTDAAVEGQQNTDEQATDTNGQTETTTDGAEENSENVEPAVEYEAVPYLVDGEPVTAEAVIENAPANGEVKLEFVFNGKDLGDRRIVAFEYMSIANMEGEDVDIAEHEDIMDEEQTVWYPDVTTEAADETTDSHVGDSAEYNVLVDKVTMRGLLPDREYTVTGSVHLSETGEEIPSTMIDEEGNPIDGFIFTADQKDMEVVLRMRYKASDLAGKTVVAYENVFTPGLDGEPKLIGRHEDPKDEEQSVHIPAVETVATDAKNDAKDTQAAESTTVKDVVKLSNLKVGYYYKISGVLMSKKGKAPVKKADGTEVRAESEVFVADAANMEKILNFELNTSEMTDDTLVAFEKLYFYGKETPVEEGSDNIKEIARHEDITDEDQSVNVIDLRTTATGKDTGSHEAGVDKETKIVDRVYYYGLDVNKEYTVKGTLRNKETGEPIKGATASKTFKPKKKDHYIDLTFTVDTRKLVGKKVVAFEDLYRDNIPVATHSNLEDEDQTVSIVEIKTSLKDKKTGKRTATEGKDTILIDTVTYKGLIPGNTYVMKGTLMDKETKKSTGIKKSVTFTADKSNGSVEIPFTVNTEKYAGKSLVAFEELYTEDNKLITTHKDIKDKKQTVAIPGNPEKPGSGNGTLSNVKTGDQMKPLLFAGIAVLALGVFLFVYFRKKKKA